MNPPPPDHSPSAQPHESGHEAKTRQQLADLLQQTPIPADELVDNLALYLGRKPLMDLLALDALFRSILTVPGVIMEFGVRWGRHLATLTALRSLHEPYNVHRRIIGFDTFTGFPSVSDVDRVSIVKRSARAILVDDRDRLVLIKRTRPGEAPYWTAPGGGVDDTDPSPSAALARELGFVEEEGRRRSRSFADAYHNAVLLRAESGGRHPIPLIR